MNIKIAENIRAFRKARMLTQEQLAEALGVTVGAVYKWEAKLSLPELGLIMEMADLFDTSVDVLLGYEMKDNGLRATVQRLKEYRSRKDRVGLLEAEKALKKYPNAFDIVHTSAVMYSMFGLEDRDKVLLCHALELLEHARLLLPQNTDPKINESTLHGKMAQVYLALEEPDRAVGILKEHNAGGVYNDLIGLTLAGDCKRTTEALPYLEDALLTAITGLTRVVTGFLNLYFAQGDFSSAQASLQWSIGVFSGLTEECRPNFLWKINSVLYVCLGFAQEKAGDSAAARRSLCSAKELAMQFDACPDYRANAICFVTHADQAGIYDDLGATAMESIKRAVEQTEDAAMDALWKELNENEE